MMNAADIIKKSKPKNNNANNNHVDTYAQFLYGNPSSKEIISVDDVIYRKPKKDKKKKSTILIERKLPDGTNPNREVNKNNKPLLIDYIMQEIERINDLDYI